MKIKKILMLFIILISLAGCTKISDLSINDIISKLNMDSKKVNTYRQGFEFYTPKGLAIEKAGTNYVILSSSNLKYYLYIDMISYNSKEKINHKENNNFYFSKDLKYHENNGFIDIKLTKNNQYLVEIMYNYATIEVMVDRSLLNHALINSINILNSIKYNDDIIKTLLEDDNLEYTEEIFNIFDNVVSDSDTLDVIEDSGTINDEPEEEIKDTDYIN